MKNKYCLIQVLPNLSTGGAERVTIDLIKYLDINTFDIYLLILHSSKNTIFEKEIINNSKIKIIFLNKKPGFNIKIIFLILKYFIKIKPDIVHTHLQAIIFAIIPYLFLNIPVKIHTVHSIAEKEADYWNKYIMIFIRYFAFNFLKVIPVSCSKEVAKTVNKLYKCNSPIIYNPVDMNRFNNNIIPEKDNFIRLISIGRFKPAKNHFLLLNSFYYALKKNNNLLLLLVGEGELMEDIKNYVKKLNIEKHIIFLGLRNDIPELLFKSDIFILSSKWEGFPIAVLEAMAAGKPVIVTRVGGIPEIVDNMENGLLIEPDDQEGLKNAILKLSDDRYLRTRLGNNGKEKVKKYFEASIIAKEYTKLYLENYGK